MMAQAKRYNIKGRSTMNADELRQAVGEAVKNTPTPRGGAASKMLKGLAGPIAAGAAAYAMTPGRANAADGSQSSGQSEALTNAGIASGVAAGTNRLLRALPSAGPAIGAIGAGMTAYDNASEAQQYRAAMPEGDRSSVAGQLLPHVMPMAMRGAQDIASIASAPGRIRDAAVSAMTPGNATPSDYQGSLYPEAAPMEAPAAAPEQDFDAQLAELQQLLSQVGADEQTPVPNAAASYQVAQMPQRSPAYSMPRIASSAKRDTAYG